MFDRKKSSSVNFLDLGKKEAAARACMLRARAAQTPAGPEREALLREARACEVASQVDHLLDSCGLQPPST